MMDDITHMMIRIISHIRSLHTNQCLSEVWFIKIPMLMRSWWFILSMELMSCWLVPAWSFILVSRWLVTSFYKPFRPSGRAPWGTCDHDGYTYVHPGARSSQRRTPSLWTINLSDRYPDTPCKECLPSHFPLGGHCSPFHGKSSIHSAHQPTERQSFFFPGCIAVLGPEDGTQVPPRNVGPGKGAVS